MKSREGQTAVWSWQTLLYFQHVNMCGVCIAHQSLSVCVILTQLSRSPTWLPLLLWSHRSSHTCLLTWTSTNSNLLQGGAPTHHGPLPRMTSSHWAWRPTFGETFSKSNSSDQGVGVSGVEGRFVLTNRWKTVNTVLIRWSACGELSE